MSRYRITEADKIYAVEFKRNLEADDCYHSSRGSVANLT